jgi:hypothetical protein
MNMRKRKRAACARYSFGLQVAALFAELAEAAEILRAALDDMDAIEPAPEAAGERRPTDDAWPASNR